MQMVNDFHVLALKSSPFIVTSMISGYYLGQELLVGIGALMALYFLLKRYWPELIMVLVGWGGETGILLLLSTYFNRPRPEFAVSAWPGMTMIQPSFPSGHVFGAVMGFGLLAYLVAPKMATRFGKFLVIATAVAMCVYIGFSRVFIGHHYPSDILAGFAVGIAWAGLVYTTVELIFVRRKHQQEEMKHD
jgi:undecaprenyl-diphosphatase